MSKQVPIAEGLFTWPAARPALLTSRCRHCGIASFPAAESCMACSGQDVAIEELPGRGTLWTWTVQAFPPKAPPYLGPVGDDFVPFGVGYVELADQVRVEARLTESDPAKLVIGMEMELVLEPLCIDEDGNQVVTYAFAPVDTGSKS